MTNTVAETTPRRRDRAACILTTARLCMNPLPKLPNNWGQVDLNLNDYHSNPMEISSRFWIPDIANWRRHKDETHSKYANLANVAQDIFSIIPDGVRVEGSVSLGWDVIGWIQWNTTGETVCQEVGVRQFAWANTGILVGNDPA